MAFTNNSYTYTPGSSRLLNPVNLANVPSYDFEASSGLVQEALQLSNPNNDPAKFYYLQQVPGATNAPPSSAPSTPLNIITPTSSQIVMYFTVAGITGNPRPRFSFLYGTTENPTTPFPASRASPELSVYVGTFTGLLPNTTYYFKAVASNTYGTLASAVSDPVVTAPSGGANPPSAPPTVPAVSGTPTTTSITVTFDAAGITGDAPITFSALVGNSPGSVAGPVPATLVSGTTYRAIATGLNPNVTYYFKSVASNAKGQQVSAVSAGIPTAPNPPSPVLKTHFMMTFLAVTNGVWNVDTGTQPTVGSMILTGANAGTISQGAGQPNQAGSVAQLKAWRAQPNCKVLVSLGGAAFNVTQLIPNAQTARDICNSIWNSLFGANTCPNPLNWSNASWAGGPNPFFFDGIDIDWENATPDGVPQAFAQQWASNVTAYGSITGAKILSGAPQSPNAALDVPSSTPWGYFSGGNLQLPFEWTGADLSTIAPAYLAVTAPAFISQYLNIFDELFIQCYNNPAQDLVTSPGVLNPIFVKCLAQWAYIVMLANRRNGSKAKIMFGFATSTAGVSTPPWVDANEPILNTAITQINALVSAELAKNGLAQCVPTDWNCGIGFWTSPSANSASVKAYDGNSTLTRANLGGATTQLWMEAANPSPNVAWGLLPNGVVDARPA